MGNPLAIYYALRHVVGILLFPGVMVHEAAHVLFCKIFHVRIVEVRYFKIAKRLGYVSYEDAPTPFQNILIGLAPLFVSPLLGFGLGALLLIPTVSHLLHGPISVAYCWLGISIGSMGAPSFADVQIARQLVMTARSRIVRSAAYGLIGVALFGAIAGLFLLDIAGGIVLFFGASLIWK